jgi:hypothetical protein
MMDLRRIVESTTLDAQQIAARTAQIHAAVLAQSNYIDAANFTAIHPADVELLFEQYDGAFFGGQFREALSQTPIQFVLSKRMTSAGGKTATFVDRRSGSRRYEISVSTTILFGCFLDDDHRPITVSGIDCRDRLEALQRVLEHELTHLVESVLWDASNCSQPRFQSISRRLFGHTKHKHRLITPRERAMAKFGIQPGTKVRFVFDGVALTGIVNRVNKRATVLVEDNNGVRYTNGKRYAKFYVPVRSLEAVE